ncbi:MAG: hypothetical protein MMC33_004837 [Icmadophila ericetorum]|nr:hypothetical protein [Icmadophila ericetorum]
MSIERDNWNWNRPRETKPELPPFTLARIFHKNPYLAMNQGQVEAQRRQATQQLVKTRIQKNPASARVPPGSEKCVICQDWVHEAKGVDQWVEGDTINVGKLVAEVPALKDFKVKERKEINSDDDAHFFTGAARIKYNNDRVKWKKDYDKRQAEMAQELKEQRKTSRSKHPSVYDLDPFIPPYNPQETVTKIIQGDEHFQFVHHAKEYEPGFW